VRHVAAWGCWWVGLFWLWLLLAGEWNRQQWIAAAAAAAVAATIAEIARTAADARARVPLRWIGRAWTVPLMVFVDFGVVAWALVAGLARGRLPRGRFVAREFSVDGNAETQAGVRAWVTLAAAYSPNAYVIDIERKHRLVLIHDLVPLGRSGKPA
jgi:multisubunit Na+/H+ antiporter MnhE subunit